ncbi:hemerythrin domain-containing protein [Methylobacter psychrophilus]|uniref:hemerythrin domain-containing protein n=1 Tax=Methylobacter psychrophilus TaxID=96941 RepID=UPI0021D51039|nr:hemerythrin domain-containing protein [Methylobacter psychrophilus]
MLVTENLMKEHQLILKYIGLMERYAESALNEFNSFILFEKANDFIVFIDDFADDFHHAKEEDILFRYLDVPGVLTHCNPVPQMLLEHNKAREFVSNMKNSLRTKTLNELVVNMSQYASLLKEHIYKEDNILYPMAERGLSDEAKLSLLKGYATTDNRLNSPDMWCKFEALYTELESSLNV